MRRKRKWDREDEDPAAGLLNLFDIWLVFAISLLLAVLSYSQVTSQKPVNSVMQNEQTGELEIVTKNGKEIETLKMTNNKITGEGERLGTAYRLKSGKVVYVPESKK